MADIVHNNFLRPDKATRYHEKCKHLEKGIKKTRNIFGGLFLFNTLIFLVLKFFPEHIERITGPIEYINSILPVAGFIVSIFVILSFAWLVAFILKSYHAEKNYSRCLSNQS